MLGGRTWTTARRITIDADPTACADGLAVLTELRRAGRDDLGGAIDALAAIVSRGEAKKKLRDWREVPTHLAMDYDDLMPAGCRINTFCGMRDLGVDSMSRRGSAGSYECVTIGTENLINVTDGPEVATCLRCLRAKAAKEKREARKKSETGGVG
jgi:hypothetical protein